MTFKRLRIAALLIVLATVAAMTYLQRSRVAAWNEPLSVDIYPINGDGSAAASSYIRRLDAQTFRPIAEFIERESRHYGKNHSPVVLIGLREEIVSRPPEPPAQSGRLSVIGWSLRLRFWAMRHAASHSLASSTVRMFVLYHAGVPGEALKHSLGLRKGLIGVVHAFADDAQTAQNNVVIAHELLHTLGASDKYSAQGLPVFPDGFGEPEREPLYPQATAEIMGGRVMLGPDEAAIPESLAACVIGARTAAEINW